MRTMYLTLRIISSVAVAVAVAACWQPEVSVIHRHVLLLPVLLALVLVV